MGPSFSRRPRCPIRRVDFFSSADNLLPQNPAIKRSLQWLPVIVVAKGLEVRRCIFVVEGAAPLAGAEVRQCRVPTQSVFGLPLLNWVYVAYSASMVQVS